MLIVQILRWTLLAVEVLVALPIIYLSILSISAIINAKRREKRNSGGFGQPRTNFAILIPAHNEEVILSPMLENLKLIDYPQELRTFYLVADNCTDKTAEIARSSGVVKVYERNDTSKRGKGYALNWLMAQLEQDKLIHDAYIIVDADTRVGATFLRAMDRELTQGAQAIQGHNTVLNGTESPSAALRWIAMTLINHVRPLGRNGIGGSSTLTGNGMCLSRDLLVRFPWQAFSLAEDYQYYINLVEHGVRVRYAPDAVVRSEMPTTFSQMRTQDIRWEAGNSEGSDSAWSRGRRLFLKGLSSGDITRIDAAAELLTPPLSTIMASSLLVLIASLLLFSPLDLVVGLILFGCLLFYMGTAFALVRPPRAVYLALLYAPFFMVWKLWVYFVLSRSKKHTKEWIRTSRTAS